MGFKKLAMLISWIMTEYDQSDGSVKGLDAGCGKGDIAIALSHFGYKMMGIDISREVIHEANLNKDRFAKYLKFALKFVPGDVEDLEITDLQSTFDFCICSDVLEHVRHPEKALASIHNVLNPEGVLLLTIPNGYGPYSLLCDHIRNKFLIKVLPSALPSDHIQTFTYWSIKQKAHKARFRIEKVIHSDFISFLPLLARQRSFCRWDCKLADLMPALLVSGWYFFCRKYS